MLKDPRKTTRHQKMRAAELALHPLCANCQKRSATEIHHPWPIGDGGPCFDPRNRVPLCGTCHRLESANPTFYFTGD